MGALGAIESVDGSCELGSGTVGLSGDDAEGWESTKTLATVAA